jgi:microcompartment protein CcmL/EutN
VKKYPAIAVIEFSSIADGIFTTDAILKKAPIAMLKAGTVSRGRYLTIFVGTTGSVSESLSEALVIGADSVLDHAFLPDMHPKIHDALMGQRTSCGQDAIAILETDTISATVRVAEVAIKGMEVNLVELRLAEYEMSGKAISVYSGELREIQSAMDLASDFLRNRQASAHYRIIARPHEALAQQIDHTTRYNDAKLHELEGEEAS